MFAAARWGDPVSHDQLVPSGVIGPPLSGPAPGGFVFVEAMPAAYMGCSCVCAGALSFGIAHPPPPGPPPPIVMGSLTVMINKRPAARWFPSGDLGACGVFPGLAAMMATRRVFIGGPPGGPAGLPVTLNADGSISVGSSIVIKGSSEFQNKVLDRLAIMASTNAGRTTLANIDASGKTMTIIEFTGPNSFAGPDSFKDATAAGQPVFDGAGQPINTWWGLGPQATGTGKGSDVTVQFNPDLTLPNSSDPSNPMPNDAILWHEMQHGSHQMNGNYDGSPVPGWTTQEEQNTISAGSPSEADYLRERGYPWRRTSHDVHWAPNP